MDELGNKNESTLIFQSKNTFFSCTNIILMFSIVRSSSVYSGLSHTRIMGRRPPFQIWSNPAYIYLLLSLSLFTSIQYTEQSQVMLLHELPRMHEHISASFFKFLQRFKLKTIWRSVPGSSGRNFIITIRWSSTSLVWDNQLLCSNLFISLQWSDGQR